MKVIKTKFTGLKIIQQKKFFDFRGNLRETFRKKIIKWDDLVFEYATASKKNVLRGFHFQYKFQQAKFVTVLKGKILDCVIDLRKGSKTFGKSYKIELSEENCKSLYIPEGFAHGFQTLTDDAEVIYQMSQFYSPSHADGFRWDDPSFNIEWPSNHLTISSKDRNYPDFAS